MELEFAVSGDENLPSRLLGRTERARRGDDFNLGGGITLAFAGVTHVRDFGQVDLVNLILSFPVGVIAGYVANSLSRHLRAEGVDEIVYKSRRVKAGPIELEELLVATVRGASHDPTG